MRKIRVMIVDDSATVRRLVSLALATLPDLEVVATASNGQVALTLLPEAKPDVLLLDIEMPVMGGLETLVNVRRNHPGLPVIVFTSGVGPGSEVVLDALWLGACDYAIKASAGSADAAVEHIRTELVPRIRGACVDVPAGPAAPVAPVGPRPAVLGTPPPRRPTGCAIEVLAIGSSTGGPDALAAVLGALPADLPVPVVLVQHMPPLFTGFLASRLTARSPLPTEEARNGDVLSPGRVWLAPGGWHMTLARAGRALQVRLDHGPPINSCRPSVDSLFLSAAEVCGPCVLAMVLTGMGQDGLRGAEQIRMQHGQVLVQDEASSVVWGMPGAIARAGLADAVLPLDELAAEVVRRVRPRKERRREAA